HRKADGAILRAARRITWRLDRGHDKAARGARRGAGEAARRAAFRDRAARVDIQRLLDRGRVLPHERRDNGRRLYVARLVRHERAAELFLKLMASDRKKRTRRMTPIPVDMLRRNVEALGRQFTADTEIVGHSWRGDEYGLEIRWSDGFTAWVGMGA